MLVLNKQNVALDFKPISNLYVSAGVRADSTQATHDSLKALQAAYLLTRQDF